MRLWALGLVTAQIYDHPMPGGYPHDIELDPFFEDPHRIVQPYSEVTVAASSQKTYSPTIRPPEFDHPPLGQQSVAPSASGDLMQSSALLPSSGSVIPPISIEEGFQFLQKALGTGMAQLDRLGHVLAEEMNSISIRPPARVYFDSALANRPGPSQPLGNENQAIGSTLQQVSVPDFPRGMALSPETLPWWRSSSFLNEAVTKSSLEIDAAMGTNRQVAIDGIYGVVDQWVRLFNSVSDLQRRLNYAMFKLQEWSIGLLIPSSERTFDRNHLEPLSEVKVENLGSLQQIRERAQSLELHDENLDGLSYPGSIDFLPLELKLKE